MVIGCHRTDVGPKAMSDKTIWILGTGFSAPLGGPMLNQLFALGARNRLPSGQEGSFDFRNPAVDLVYHLYHKGRAFKDGHPAGFKSEQGYEIWQNAEDFIDQLDAAAEEMPSR